MQKLLSWFRQQGGWKFQVGLNGKLDILNEEINKTQTVTLR
jgi:hypothetical protein